MKTEFVKLKYQDIKFKEEKDSINAVFLTNYYFKIPRKEIEKIGEYKIEEGTIVFKGVSEKSAKHKFSHLLERYFNNLTNLITKKPTIYIRKNLGIPLIGNTVFGIIYRNTNIIEVKPVTGCNLNCVYCSIDEGVDTKKANDFVVECDYLVEEIKKMAEFIGEEWHCHIGTHGEPLLYPNLTKLIGEVAKIDNIRTISMDTNATLLTEKKIDELVEAGLTRFNVSLDAIDEEIAKKMCNAHYNVSHIKNMCKYITKKASLLIAPVFVRGWNDKEIERIIQFALEINKKDTIKLGIQNFLEYPRGRNPTKQMLWSVFYSKLSDLEKKYKTKLILSAKDFGIKKSRVLEKPFKKGDLVKAKIVCEGLYKNEKIAVADGRSINILRCNKKVGDSARIRIIRDKHNCFAGFCN
ncbi:MAG: radical SAM protein [Candidatus Woesearchaeota archaeon]